MKPNKFEKRNPKPNLSINIHTNYSLFGFKKKCNIYLSLCTGNRMSCTAHRQILALSRFGRWPFVNVHKNFTLHGINCMKLINCSI